MKSKENKKTSEKNRRLFDVISDLYNGGNHGR